MFADSFKGFPESRVFRGSVKSVSRKFQECFKDFSGKCELFFKKVLTKIKGTFK